MSDVIKIIEDLIEPLGVAVSQKEEIIKHIDILLKETQQKLKDLEMIKKALVKNNRGNSPKDKDMEFKINKIKELKKEGLTQTQISQRLGLSRQTVSKYLKDLD